MRHAIGIVGMVNLVLFAAIAGVCVRQWVATARGHGTVGGARVRQPRRRRRAGYLLPDDPERPARKVVQRIDIALLLLFPYLLYRFASAFEPTRVRWRGSSTRSAPRSWSATLVLPSHPAEGDAWPWWFVAYAVAFLVHWSVLLQLVAIRLWRAGGRRRPWRGGGCGCSRSPRLRWPLTLLFSVGRRGRGLLVRAHGRRCWRR